jgi:nicotinate-nucleotide--dimethylbenzimidazole phosphoribosyltransferase
MPATPTPLIAPTARPALEQALRSKLHRRNAVAGSLGELEPLAIRLGLIQNTVRPRLRQPQMLVFAGDHGLAVDVTSPESASSCDIVNDILATRVPLPVFAHQQGLNLHVVDAGLAAPLKVGPGLLARKIAHGTRNCRVAQAMSVDQVNAAIRAGMQIAEALPGNVLACAGLGVGSLQAAGLVISRITGLPLRDIMTAGPDLDGSGLEHHMVVLQAAQTRHANIDDPVEVLAAFGGFETAMMVGAMLVAASKRHLIMVDGIAACAALIVATHIGGPVTDYCVFCRSTTHQGLDSVLAGFQATALLDMGMNSLDGTGTTLTWPLVHSAASLLSDLADLHEHAPETAPPETRPAVDGNAATMNLLQRVLGNVGTVGSR